MTVDSAHIVIPGEEFDIQEILRTRPDGVPTSWKALCRRTGREVVVKSCEGMLSEEDRRLWLALRPDAWVPFQELEREGDRAMLTVRPWNDLPTLQSVLARPHLAPSEVHARAFFGAAALALEALHEVGLVHGQIKAQNVFVMGWEPLLCDPDPVRRDPLVDAEALAMLPRSVFSLNPELVGRRSLTPASDVYSLACLLYRWLTGEPPFQGDYAPLLYAQYHSLEAPKLRQLRPDLSENLEAVLAMALRRDSAERYPDAGAFAEALLGRLSFQAEVPPEPALDDTTRPLSLQQLAGPRYPREITSIGPLDVKNPDSAYIAASDLDLIQTAAGEAGYVDLNALRGEVLRARKDPSEKQKIPIVLGRPGHNGGATTPAPKPRPVPAPVLKNKEGNASTKSDTDVIPLPVQAAPAAPPPPSRPPLNPMLNVPLSKPEASDKFRVPFFILAGMYLLTLLIFAVLLF